jgi:hypothetical protein
LAAPPARRRRDWREQAFYDSAWRFQEITQVLREAYGTRLRELRPTRRSLTYLHGDDFTAPDRIRSTIRALAETTTAEDDHA